MDINQISPTGGGGLPPTGLTSPQLGRDEFLQLLVTQLRNQDPLSPMDNTEFVSQLAEFSGLEQMQLVNEQLGLEAQMLQGNANSLTTAMIGRDVVALGDTLEFDGRATSVHFELESNANATVQIRDESGQVVRTLESTGLSAGRAQVAWDGRDDAGNPVAHGTYRFDVEGHDSAGNTIASIPLIHGEVTGVRFGGGGAVLMVGSREVLLSNVLEITERPDDGIHT